MKTGEAVHFLLRAVRFGPLVPARLWLCDHDPADPDNKLDRGRLSVFPRAEIDGREIDPDLLQSDRLISPTDWRPAYRVGHWKYARPIDRAEYEFQMAHRGWRRRARPDDVTLDARIKVKPGQLPIPIFEKF